MIEYDEMYGRYKKQVLMKIFDKAYKKTYEYISIDYKDKTVLDIGADWGSTALFFLKKGAKKIVAVEPDEESYKKLVDLSGDKPILPIPIAINHPKEIERLISENKPDLVKIDCEGCEQHVVGVKKDVLRIPEMYIIEQHNIHDFSIRQHMISNGFDMVGCFEWANTNNPELFERTKLEVVVYERRLD